MKPTLLVIFGFTGDLVRRYFLPALYHLELDGELPEDLAIMATTRRDIDLNQMKESLTIRINELEEECNLEIVDKLFSKIEVSETDISDKNDYEKLKKSIEDHDEELCKNRIFYFAVPPDLFETVLDNVTGNKLHLCGDGITARLLIEKPFGRDTKTAQGLLDKINQNFGSEHLFPIDHYMAKETVQNILYFRFQNPIIRAIWDSKHIQQIQISAIESLDIQGRANFYEQTGAVRDMIQSHLLQLAALATMEEPQMLDAASIRSTRQRALEAFTRITPEMVPEVAVRGQYHGYRDEVRNQESLIETFAAIKFTVDSERWRGVPIYVRAGKALNQKVTEITLIYNDPKITDCEDNVLTLRIQPNEGVAIRLTGKKPGLKNETQNLTMDYCYLDEHSQLHGAYEKILIDAINGDQTLFPTDKEIINNWQLIEPILNDWHSSDQGLETYKKGSSEITKSNELLAKENHEWISLPNICQPRWQNK
jgi:glucose-6-phosphate 1-dehydrogenase